ncbi:tail fiber assembly protein [Photorhabdus luminescens]|uniref:tail fiber assembly protein n=1 Tax=Photorhabdus akhurstii TaxID=171438 RepID=UPI00068A070C
MNNDIQLDKLKQECINNYFYSAKANGFFYRPYDESESCVYPDDMKPISDALYKQLMIGQENGKVIVADDDGMPTLGDIPPPTLEELQQWSEREKQYLMLQAANFIAPLQDAVDLNIATENEQAALAEWKKYRVLLNRVDCSTAPKIGWPKKPE